MASVHDFFLTGDHDAAKAQFNAAVEAQGFTLSSTPKGMLAKRGSLPLTLLLGAMAGKKNFQVTFIVEFFVDAAGQFVARLSRDLASGALKGGAIGANMTNNSFVDTAAGISAALQGSGILASQTSS
ncbi:MAG: hypothetical protein ACOH1T_08370 [Microbacteriaceae bacterium]